DDFNPFGGAGNGLIHRGFHDHGEHFILELLHQPASNHDDFRIEEVDDIGGRDASVFRGFFDHVLDELVAAFDRLAQITAAQVLEFRTEHFGQNCFLALLHGLLDGPEDGGATGQRFEATFVATAAFRPADLDHHVANLSRCAIEAGIQLPFDDPSAADNRAEQNTHH